jgi:hypothetical protein
MSFGIKIPELPKVPEATPLPQPDDPSLVDLSREAALKAKNREGFEASMLNPLGGSSSQQGPAAQTQKTVLGYGV